MQEKEIKASVLHSPKDLRLETRPISAPAPSELQISIRSTGLCGSDLHYYNHARNGDIIVQEPLSLGHESAGVVVQVGAEASSHFRVGDRVALEVGVPCGDCARCGEGRYNVCKDMRFRSSAKSVPHFQGTLQQRINHPARWCHKLPKSIPFALGALLEPLGVAIHAARRAALPPQSIVLVFGAGAVGLLTAAMAKNACATEIVIADIDQGRVDFAVANGFADIGHIVPMRRGKTIEEELEIAKDTAAAAGKAVKTVGTVWGGFDAVFECTGSPACVQAGIYATRPGGKVMLIGMGTPIQTLPLSAAALREVDLRGVFRYADTYEAGIEIISKRDANSPDLSKLITHTFNGLENVEDAFQMASKTKDAKGNLVLKVVIDMDEQDETIP